MRGNFHSRPSTQYSPLRQRRRRRRTAAPETYSKGCNRMCRPANRIPRDKIPTDCSSRRRGSRKMVQDRAAAEIYSRGCNRTCRLANRIPRDKNPTDCSSRRRGRRRRDLGPGMGEGYRRSFPIGNSSGRTPNGRRIRSYCTRRGSCSRKDYTLPSSCRLRRRRSSSPSKFRKHGHSSGTTPRPTVNRCHKPSRSRCHSMCRLSPEAWLADRPHRSTR
jgi:hypothetical protein